jgi:putative ABC transport system substrate-binding protein
MRRREFISLIGSVAATWPLAARAQQSAMPVIGFLHSGSDTLPERQRGFRQGLKDTGFVEGENLAVVYRWAENQMNRLPELVTELVHRQVAVLVTVGNATTLVAKVSAFGGKADIGLPLSDPSLARTIC